MSEYIERLPDGVLPMREALIEKYSKQEVTAREADVPVSQEV